MDGDLVRGRGVGAHEASTSLPACGLILLRWKEAASHSVSHWITDVILELKLENIRYIVCGSFLTFSDKPSTHFDTHLYEVLDTLDMDVLLLLDNSRALISSDCLVITVFVPRAHFDVYSSIERSRFNIS